MTVDGLTEAEYQADLQRAIDADVRADEAYERGVVSAGETTDDEEDRPPRSLEEIRTELEPLGQRIRASLADIALIPVAKASPAQRTELVTLRADLDRVRADLSTWLTAIDISFRRAAMETGADEFPLTDGVVKIEQQRGEWVVNVPALRTELKEFLAAGVITEHEFESVFSTVVTEKADNTRLNALGKHRGGEIAEAIGRSRVWKAGDPANAKVRIQRGGPK
jgi:hypothetical protein